ncbi:MAG: hypothetical protein OEV91_05750, partial [Desulfobulbaceae bacterium]|nr:hypothetical protein [Desulfobulbaceae bacterium]
GKAAFSPDRGLTLSAAMVSHGLGAALAHRLEVKDLDADLRYEKRYHFRRPDTGRRSDDRPLLVNGLSKTVLRRTGEATPAGLATRQGIGTATAPLAATRFVNLASLRARGGGKDLTLRDLRLELDTTAELPTLEKFRFDLLGGTVVGSLALTREQDRYFGHTSLNFSGLNTARLLPGFELPPGKDAEMNGGLVLSLPLATRVRDMLKETTMRLAFSHIGGAALERLLFSLDPYENNESIVAQRQLLAQGSPKWVRLEIDHGFLAIHGEIVAKGMTIRLPDVERINLAELSLVGRLPELAAMERVTKVLELLSARTIAVSEEGKLSFEKKTQQ